MPCHRSVECFLIHIFETALAKSLELLVKMAKLCIFVWWQLELLKASWGVLANFLVCPQEIAQKTAPPF